MKDALAKNLYSIELINKNVTRRSLSMAYTPGVGAVCQAIETDPIEAETTTFRPRAVAIITDGSFIEATSSGGVGPALDWLVAQIKYYSGLDAFPFIIEKDTDLEDALKDFSTSYGTVLELDDKELPYIPNDLLVVRQKDVAAIAKTQITNAEKTANILSYLIDKKKKGLAK